MDAKCFPLKMMMAPLKKKSTAHAIFTAPSSELPVSGMREARESSHGEPNALERSPVLELDVPSAMSRPCVPSDAVTPTNEHSPACWDTFMTRHKKGP